MSVSNFSADPFAEDLADFQEALAVDATIAEVQAALAAFLKQQERDDAVIALLLDSGLSREDLNAIQLLTEMDIAERQVAQNVAALVCQEDFALALRMERGDG